MKFGLIGEKLGHSFSVEIHKLLGNENYILQEIKPSELEEFFTKKDFKGVNVTIPYKEEVLKYLNKIDKKAQEIGSVNTITNIGGKLLGFNSDYFGLKALIKHFNIDIENKDVFILGTGGTSKTAFTVCKDLGAKNIKKVGRNGSGDLNYNDLIDISDTVEVIINTTPVGMWPNIDDSIIDVNNFKNLKAVIDVIYNPITTKLVSDARKKNITAVNGLYMLVAQAVYSDAFFYNGRAKTKKIDEIYNLLLKKKLNIVLTGMPGCGKTSLGRQISKDLNLDFYDSDEIIEKRVGKPIKEIFENEGENYFRKIENEVIKELSTKENSVISIGGGTLLNNENISKLKRNGIFFYINRRIELLSISTDRPLSKNREELEALYLQRKEIYENSADLIIYNNDSPLNTIKEIEEKFYEENFNY